MANRPLHPLLHYLRRLSGGKNGDGALDDAQLLAQFLPRLAEMSDYNVVGDPRAKDKLQTEITAQLNNVPIDSAVRLLANMAGLTVVRLDNVFYVTTEENAKHLREERARFNAEEMAGTAGPQPATAKPVK